MPPAEIDNIQLGPTSNINDYTQKGLEHTEYFLSFLLVQKWPTFRRITSSSSESSESNLKNSISGSNSLTTILAGGSWNSPTVLGPVPRH